jgi:hypothetical protein
VILFQIASLDDTIELPGTAVTTEPAPEPEVDEDTLGGAKQVPVIETATAAPKKRRRVSWKVVVPLVIVLILAAAGAAVYGATRANFIGVDKNGYVAVYQGVPWNLPFGIHLYREVYTSHLLAAELAQPGRKKLFDHTLRSRNEAEDVVKTYSRYVVGSQ